MRIPLKFLAMLALGICLAGAGWAGTSDLYRAEFFISGYVFDGVYATNSNLAKVQVTTRDLINFSLRRNLTNHLNKSEILALASDCTGPQLQLLVYDLNSLSNLATIGAFQPILDVQAYQNGKSSEELIANLNLLPTTDGTNGLAGGALQMAARINGDTNSCFTSLSAQMLGTFSADFWWSNRFFTFTNSVTGTTTNTVTITNYFVGITNYNVAVSGGTLKTTGRKIGQLIQP